MYEFNTFDFMEMRVKNLSQSEFIKTLMNVT